MIYGRLARTSTRRERRTKLVKRRHTLVECRSLLAAEQGRPSPRRSSGLSCQAEQSGAINPQRLSRAASIEWQRGRKSMPSRGSECASTSAASHCLREIARSILDLGLRADRIQSKSGYCTSVSRYCAINIAVYYGVDWLLGKGRERVLRSFVLRNPVTCNRQHRMPHVQKPRLARVGS